MSEKGGLEPPFSFQVARVARVSDSLEKGEESDG
jgi:hypothetical protein